MEIWKKIKGWPYEVSSLGRVRSLHSYAHSVGRLRKPVLNKNGYLEVFLSQKRGRFNGRKMFSLHRLVMETFSPPKEKLQVNHKNSNKLDNRLINLEWVSPLQNMRHATENGRFKTQKALAARKKFTERARAQNGENNLSAKLTKLQALDIFHSNDPTSVLMKRFGISSGCVYSIKKKKTWKHITKEL